jgi:hypothetical protein
MSTAVKSAGQSELHHRNGTANGVGSKFVVSEAGKAADKRLDKHET